MKFDRPVIDSHMHLTTWTDFKERDMFSFFRQNCNDHEMKAYNICACATEPEGRYDASNMMLAALVKLNDPRAYAYGGLIYPEAPAKFPMPEGYDFVTQYNELKEIGFDGIKMIESKPTDQKKYQVDLSDENYEPFFDLCEKNGDHMIWHACDPETFWDIDRIPKRHLAKGWYYGGGGYMSLEQLYKMIFSVLERHPKLRVNFAHFFFCSYRPEILVDLFEKYENVGVDITPGAEMYGAFNERHDFYRDFFIKYADRIMYGTDTVFGGGDRNHMREDQVYKVLTTDETVTVVDIPCKGLALPDKVLDKILYLNFEKAAGKRPKPIDPDALKAYYEKNKKLIRFPEIAASLEEYFNKN